MVYTNTVTNYDEFLKIFFLNERGLLVLKGERWLSVPWKTNTPPLLVGVKKSCYSLLGKEFYDCVFYAYYQGRNKHQLWV